MSAKNKITITITLDQKDDFDYPSLLDAWSRAGIKMGSVFRCMEQDLSKGMDLVNTIIAEGEYNIEIKESDA